MNEEERTFEYFNMPGRPFSRDRVQLWCGNMMEARRVHWEDLDDLLNRLMEMNEAWGGERERGAWKSWIHSVVLAATAVRTMAHRPPGFEDLNSAPDGTKWMLRIIAVEKKDDDAAVS